MILKILAAITLMILFQSDRPTIELTLIHKETGAAMVNMEIIFIDEAEELTGSCKSDGAGQCVIELVGEFPANNTVRGSLDLGSSGVRSVIFLADEPLIMELFFNDFGQVLIPGHSQHPTIDSFAERPTALPSQQVQVSPTAIATTEFVVVEPEKRAEENEPDPAVIIIGSEETEDVETIEIEPVEIVPVEVEMEEEGGNRWAVGILISLFFGLVGFGLWYLKKNGSFKNA